MSNVPSNYVELINSQDRFIADALEGLLQDHGLPYLRRTEMEGGLALTMMETTIVGGRHVILIPREVENEARELLASIGTEVADVDDFGVTFPAEETEDDADDEDPLPSDGGVGQRKLKKFLRFIVFSWVLLAVAAVVILVRSGSRSETWDDLFQAGMAAKELGDLDEAGSLLEEAVDKAEKFGDYDVRLARSLASLGGVYHSQERLTKAEAALRRSLEILDGTGASNDWAAGWTSNELGLVLWEDSRPGEAIPYLERALRIVESIDPHDYPTIAMLSSNLGLLNHEADRNAEAEPYLRRAVKLFEAVEPNGRDRLESFNVLGLVYTDLKRPDDAERAFLRAIALLDSNPQHRPEDRVGVLENLAWLYEEQGRSAEAKAILAKAHESADESAEADPP